MKLRRQHTTAIIIVVAISLWQFSGLLKSEPAPEKAADPIDRLTAVRVETITAQMHTNEISIRGRTQSIRKVKLRSKIDGQVVATPPEKGDRVKEGDVICRISIDDRAARLAEAKALARQRELEASASERLAAKGHRSETQAAASQAQLDGAKALVTQMTIELDNTEIRAPFDGIVNDRLVEAGAYLQKGDPCAVLVQEDPILIVGSVSEQEVIFLQNGTQSEVQLSDGRTIAASVRFISSVANEMTRTFRVELIADNHDRSLRDGITAVITVPIGETMAHLISSAFLVLNDDGVIGVRTLADGNIVAFKPVQILGDGLEGTWIQGLDDTEQIITVGHQFVQTGQHVRADFGEAKVGAVQ
ncbi:MAG: efflux RND transporter periplasmic adaptor subunit [Alphaproteobacteria bacterium]|nr:MAG: efflux RND transporter periplasmic adaptor subunit [Alphaproteobacteria bacterium]